MIPDTSAFPPVERSASHIESTGNRCGYSRAVGFERQLSDVLKSDLRFGWRGTILEPGERQSQLEEFIESVRLHLRYMLARAG